MIGNWSAPSIDAAQSPQIPIPGSAIPQFIQQLPILSIPPINGGIPDLPALPPYLRTINTVLGNTPLTIRMCEFDANVLPPGTFAVGGQPLTKVWGYIVGNTALPLHRIPTLARLS